MEDGRAYNLQPQQRLRASSTDRLQTGLHSASSAANTLTGGWGGGANPSGGISSIRDHSSNSRRMTRCVSIRLAALATSESAPRCNSGWEGGYDSERYARGADIGCTAPLVHLSWWSVATSPHIGVCRVLCEASKHQTPNRLPIQCHYSFLGNIDPPHTHTRAHIHAPFCRQTPRPSDGMASSAPPPAVLRAQRQAGAPAVPKSPTISVRLAQTLGGDDTRSRNVDVSAHLKREVRAHVLCVHAVFTVELLGYVHKGIYLLNTTAHSTLFSKHCP